MKRFPALALFTVLTALLMGAAACSAKSPGSATATDSPTKPAGTEEPLPASLRQMLQDVASVRNLAPPTDLKAELIARSDLPALLKSLLTADDLRWFAHTTTLYRLLGHLRKDQDYETVYEAFGGTSVLGLYSPVDKKLWVVHDDGVTIDFDNLPPQEKETLAHELVHAVQDYHFNLDRVYKSVVDDLDRNLAWTAVVEGDAVTHQQLYSRKYALVPAPSGRLFLLADLSQAQDVPPSIARELYFPYTTGADTVRAIVQKSGTKPIDAMLSNPPAGTAYLIHPELLDNGFQPAAAPLPDLASAIGNGWKRESGGSWGEFGVRNYLQLRIRAADAVAAAGGWTGDHYDVYVNGSDSLAVFRVKFKDAAAAQRFADAQQSLLQATRATSTTSDAGITLWATPDGPVTATVAGASGEVVFGIGSSKDPLLRAMAALQHG